MLLKIYAIAFFLLAQLSCGAQRFSPSELYGRWHGARLGVNYYYDFIRDSTYRYWSSVESDSTRIGWVKDLDTGYFHMVDKNHFFVLATFYATEKIVFTRELPQIQAKSNLNSPGKAYNLDSVNIYFNMNLDKFLSRMNREHFQVYNDKNAIPAFIGEQLDSLTGGFSLGNPGEEYQCCCTSSQKLPRRKLEFLAMSNDLFVITYLTGGIGVEEHILLIKFKDEKIADLWCGSSFDSLHTLQEIVKYISRKRKKPLDLHPNFNL